MALCVLPWPTAREDVDEGMVGCCKPPGSHFRHKYPPIRESRLNRRGKGNAVTCEELEARLDDFDLRVDDRHRGDDDEVLYGAGQCGDALLHHGPGPRSDALIPGALSAGVQHEHRCRGAEAAEPVPAKLTKYLFSTREVGGHD